MRISSRLSSRISSISLRKGFTLIELLVVIAIVLLISGIILFNTGRFNSAILLRSLAYQIASSLREAQLYGISVKSDLPGSGGFQSAYGLYLDSSIVGVANASFFMFADNYPSGNPDGVYESGLDQQVETFTIQNGFFIKDFCATDSSGTKCASDRSLCAGGQCWLAVTFKRPDPEAIILTSISPSEASATYLSATITVGAANGSAFTVTVSRTGEISVQQYLSS